MLSSGSLATRLSTFWSPEFAPIGSTLHQPAADGARSSSGIIPRFHSLQTAAQATADLSPQDVGALRLMARCIFVLDIREQILSIHSDISPSPTHQAPFFSAVAACAPVFFASRLSGRLELMQLHRAEKNRATLRICWKQ